MVRQTALYFIATMWLAGMVFHGALAQNVGIGTTSPHGSAQLEVSSTNKGMLLPRLNTAERDAIISPARGLLILNLDDNSLDRFDGNRWVKEGAQTAIDSIVAPGHPGPNSWVSKGKGPKGRYGAVSFTIGRYSYVGTGENEVDGKLNDFWRYDPLLNSWNQMADLPAAARVFAVGFSIGTKGYLGTGRLANGSVTNDFWEYDPATNKWASKAAVPDDGFHSGVGFSLNGAGYAGLGTQTRFNVLFKYNQATNTWSSVATWPGGRRDRAVALVVGGKAYVGLGKNQNNALQASIFPYDPVANTWGPAIASRTDLTGVGWSSFTLGALAYIGMGNNTDYLFAYNPANNTWTEKFRYRGIGVLDGIAFSAGNKGYMGFGNNGVGGGKDDFWEYMDNNLEALTSTIPQGATGAITDGAWTLNSGVVYKSGPGNVGIGTSLPTAQLEVAGTVKIGTAGTALTYVKKTDLQIGAQTLPANSTFSLQINGIAGAETGSTVFISPELDFPTGASIAYARVSAPGSIRVGFLNATSAGISLPAMTYYITIIK